VDLSLKNSETATIEKLIEMLARINSKIFVPHIQFPEAVSKDAPKKVYKLLLVAPLA